MNSRYPLSPVSDLETLLFVGFGNILLGWEDWFFFVVALVVVIVFKTFAYTDP